MHVLIIRFLHLFEVPLLTMSGLALQIHNLNNNLLYCFILHEIRITICCLINYT